MQNCPFFIYLSKDTGSYRIADVEGDKICIFGFSRGAYTARALAGMIQKVCSSASHMGWSNCYLNCTHYRLVFYRLVTRNKYHLLGRCINAKIWMG